MNKLFWGVVIGLVIGVLANPLMPPAFFVIGGVALWLIHSLRQTRRAPQDQSDSRG